MGIVRGDTKGRFQKAPEYGELNGTALASTQRAHEWEEASAAV
jgi:hypothetical protein